MSYLKIEVLQKFPLFWSKKEDEVKVGMVFTIVSDLRRWRVVGGAYYLSDSPKGRNSVPDLTGSRIRYLIKHKYIEVVSQGRRAPK